MKVLVCPSPPDIRHSIAVFDGSKSSPACPSDEGNIIMSRGFGGEKKELSKSFSGRKSRRCVKMFQLFFF